MHPHSDLNQLRHGLSAGGMWVWDMNSTRMAPEPALQIPVAKDLSEITSHLTITSQRHHGSPHFAGEETQPCRNNMPKTTHLVSGRADTGHQVSLCLHGTCSHHFLTLLCWSFGGMQCQNPRVETETRILTPE